jgi:hypothetical protein
VKKLARQIGVLILTLAGHVAAGDDLPTVTEDGLHRVPNTQVRAAYAKPGADLGEYDKIALLEVYVAFRKNWQRDHNREAIGLEGRVSDKDMQEIRQHLAEEFEKVFIDELSTKGGHEMVREGGDGVLILRPAIVNLDVTAPDTMEAGITRTFAASAGQMTLYLELYDGKTGDIIARIIDPEVAGDHAIKWSNRVTNKAEADRIIRRWAKVLNDHLAEVESATSNK